MNKKIIGIFILVLLNLTILNASANIIVDRDRTYDSTMFGNTLYVGGSGPNNYTKIQDAINDAEDGDTVYVYSGTYTSVTIYNSITLLGENKYTTIIDANGEEMGITITGDGYSDDTINWINISGFTIRNATTNLQRAGIFISFNGDPMRNISIYDNIISQNINGFMNYDGEDCKVYKNIITDNKEIGFNLYNSNYRTYITNNIITNNPIGFMLESVEMQIIEMNQIEGNEVGIAMGFNSENTIMHNNFINNDVDSKILEGHETPLSYLYNLLVHKKKWDGNYWDEWKKTSPRPIIGFFVLEIVIPRSPDNFLIIPLGIYPYITFDWHPAKEPYDIGLEL